MPTLTITTLGGLQIALDQEPVTELASRKAEALLVYLACTQQPQAREWLADWLWDDRDPKQALGNLRVVLSSLRRALPEQLVITRYDVGLAQTNVWIDCLELEQALAAAQADPTVSTAALERLEQAVALYHGEFLQGFFVRDASGFEDWTAQQREQQIQRLQSALELLLSVYTQRDDLPQALRYARRALALDPLHDSANLRLMQLLVRAGERHAAREHYERYQELLALELGLQPDAQLTALYERLLLPQLTPRLHVSSSAVPFVGREAEFQHISALLRRPDVRLLTLCGAGGVGKTRLAAHVAERALIEWPQGVVWVALMASQTSDSVTEALAEALQLNFEGSRVGTEQIMRFLEQKELLLVLDNCEQVLDALIWLDELLQRAPHVKVLLTSRERLNLAAEWVVDLHGLPYPQRDQPAAVHAAAQLFCACAERQISGWQPDADDLIAVGSICRLVHGVPLALELAASWIRTLSCREIAAEIARSLDFLQTRRRDVPAHHRSMRAVFERSWALLEPNAQHGLCRLAVFRGAFTRQAAQEVALIALPVLASLVERSLLMRSADERFVLHPLVHQFALEQLESDVAAAEQAQQRFAAWMAQFVADQTVVLESGAALKALQLLVSELENIQAACLWSAQEQRCDLLLTLLIGLCELYELRGWYREGQTMLSRLIDLLSVTLQQPQAAELASLIALWQGWLSFRLSSFDAARALFDQSVALGQPLGLYNVVARALCGLGNCALIQGDLGTARREFEQALQLAQQGDHLLEQVRALNGLGVLAKNTGDYGRSRKIYEQALTLNQQLQHPWSQASLLHNLGTVCRALGDLEAARQGYEQSIELRAALNDRRGMALGLNNLANLALLRHDYVEARRLLTEGLGINREIGHPAGIALVLHNLGDVALRERSYTEAQRFYQQSLNLRRQHDDRLGLTYTLTALGTLACRQQQWQAAWAFFQEAWQLALQSGSTPLGLDILMGLAELYWQRRQLESAAEMLLLVLRHPAAEPRLRERSGDMLDQLRSAMDAERLAEIERRIAPHVSQQMLAELRPPPLPAAEV